MNRTVTVFSKPSCVQCNATKRVMDANNIKYTVVDVTEVDGLPEQLREEGYRMMPVVKVKLWGYEPIDSWQGFVPEKIKSLIL